MKQDRRVIGFLVLIEATLFVTFYYREIAWYPPAGFDQAAYLEGSYALQESAAKNGLHELLRPFVTSGNNNGVAFPGEGALFGMFLDAPRLSRLCVGFVAFAVLQLCVYSTAGEVWKTRNHGFAALGLVLCQSTAWFWAGGLFDCRMDFLAYCVYGIWACLVLRNRDQAASMSRRARILIEEQYAWDVILTKLEPWLDRIAALPRIG
jgi:hypothetical protein